MQNNFVTKIPKSDFLKRYIAYYYFDECSEFGVKKSFVYYPHYKNALTIYRNSRIQLNHTYSTTTIPENGVYSFGFSKLISSAAEAELLAPFNRIGIVFQPLGLNHFLNRDLNEIICAPIIVEFDFFKASILPILEQLFDTESFDEKVEILDTFFLSRYIGFSDNKMEEAIMLLFDSEAKFTVEELADKLKISRKTLLRMFRKHQNCSVIDYMKLLQFRRSIELFQKSKSKTSMTDIALSTAYYDQSDFIKHFKKLTGFNPKSFFKNVSIVSDQGTFWTLR